MHINKLAHFSIRSFDLEKSCRFYEKVLGFTQGYRPPFDFPGVWLYMGGDEADFGTVHIIGIDPSNPEGLKQYLGEKSIGDKEMPLTGTGTVDHIAFLVTGLIESWKVFKAEGIAWRDRTVPSLGLHQVFIEDPSGVTIELNFPASEAEAARAFGIVGGVAAGDQTHA
ncbi:MAG: glyoxalase [Pseudomonas sp.]|nr:glyoxalase [Pseudomonas sp.]